MKLTQFAYFTPQSNPRRHCQYFAYLSRTQHTFSHLAQTIIAKFLRQVHITMTIAATYCVHIAHCVKDGHSVDEFRCDDDYVVSSPNQRGPSIPVPCRQTGSTTATTNIASGPATQNSMYNAETLFVTNNLFALNSLFKTTPMPPSFVDK